MALDLDSCEMKAVVRFALVWMLLGGVCGCEEKDEPRVENDLGKETDMAVRLQWLGHASFRISSGEVSLIK